MQIDIIFSIIILIMSVVVHEVSHGYVALAFGDPTARIAGRLTLNPLKHLDLFGSIILPLLSFMVGGIIFGWAKPVPYNPYNLRNRRVGEIAVAVAGPLSNFIIALLFGLTLKFFAGSLIISQSLITIMATIVMINLVLTIFNLIPIAPLDGSKILFGLIPAKWGVFREFSEKYQLILIVILIFFLWQFVSPLVSYFFSLITGIQV